MVERRANNPPLLPLAPREQQVYTFVITKFNRTGKKTLVPQSLIAESLGMKKRAVNQYVNSIEEKGREMPVVRRKGKKRKLSPANVERAKARSKRQELVDEILRLRLEGMTNFQILISVNSKRAEGEQLSMAVIDGVLHVLRTNQKTPRIRQ